MQQIYCYQCENDMEDIIYLSIYIYIYMYLDQIAVIV